MIIVGDCLTELPKLEAGSVDSCVTDPPYGIGFMGKKWDSFKPGVAETRIVPSRAVESDNPNLKGRTRSPASSPSAVEYDRTLEGQRGFQSWTEGWAREVYRVLKPGGHLLVCGAPRSYHRMASGLEDAGFEIRDCIMWVFGSGFPKSHNLHDEWEGWGTALKPAWEPIIVARKPFAGTVAANVLQHGTGAMNISACRVPIDPEADASQLRIMQRRRWPANLIHDGSDEVLACFPDAKGQMGAVGPQHGDRSSINAYGDFGPRPDCQPRIEADKSAARFFYCAKASKADRNEGCDALPLREGGIRSETSGQHITRRDGGDPAPVPNNHPTVKPIALMRYLVRLVTPPGGTVLDPFMGSGSTGKACAHEGFNFIGIEREQDYAEISEARIAFAVKLQRQRTAQMGLTL